MDETVEIKRIIVDDNNELFNKNGMFSKEFSSDYRQIRYFTLLIVQMAPPEIKEINLLEQQVSELIKNAVKHGNKNDINKKVKVWYKFETDYAQLIVEDEGEGFKNLEKWNDFNTKRTECFLKQDFENMAQFVSFRTDKSDDNDGGNALFAAVEYWNGGVVFNKKKNCVAVKKSFPKKRHGAKIE
ncbi:MAG: ATP-binding protein [Spirochaetales bacterium]|nr:ATP-binding protein [Spirochaetales bacterium]